MKKHLQQTYNLTRSWTLLQVDIRHYLTLITPPLAQTQHGRCLVQHITHHKQPSPVTSSTLTAVKWRMTLTPSAFRSLHKMATLTNCLHVCTVQQSSGGPCRPVTLVGVRCNWANTFFVTAPRSRVTDLSLVARDALGNFR